jgi:hypothetical protein
MPTASARANRTSADRRLWRYFEAVGRFAIEESTGHVGGAAREAVNVHRRPTDNSPSRYGLCAANSDIHVRSQRSFIVVYDRPAVRAKVSYTIAGGGRLATR